MKKIITFLFLTTLLFFAVSDAQAQACSKSSPNCGPGKTCSCPEWTFDWELGEDKGDCTCVNEVVGQQ